MRINNKFTAINKSRVNIKTHDKKQPWNQAVTAN